MKTSTTCLTVFISVAMLSAHEAAAADASRSAWSAALKPTPFKWADATRLGQPFSKDPSVIRFGGRYLMYSWTQLCDKPILKPELPWETCCIEAPTLTRRGDTLVMFYAGGFNNDPQQIGVATSQDGVNWTRQSNPPLLANGAAGEWNSSESGHPGFFEDSDGRSYLFFQGNHDHGRTWLLSCVELGWQDSTPGLLEPIANKAAKSKPAK